MPLAERGAQCKPWYISMHIYSLRMCCLIIYCIVSPWNRSSFCLRAHCPCHAGSPLFGYFLQAPYLLILSLSFSYPLRRERAGHEQKNTATSELFCWDQNDRWLREHLRRGITSHEFRVVIKHLHFAAFRGTTPINKTYDQHLTTQA